MEATLLKFPITYVTMECGECGTQFALTERHQQKLHESGETFWCPRGHQRVYRETEIQKLKRQLEYKDKLLADEKASRDFWKASRDFWMARTETEKRKVAAQKAVVTKVRKRIGQGACPCCNRYFKNVDLHMSVKHPTYKTGTANLEKTRRARGAHA